MAQCQSVDCERRCGSYRSGLRKELERESAASCRSTHSSSADTRYMTRPPIRKLGGPSRLCRQTYKVFSEIPR